MVMAELVPEMERDGNDARIALENSPVGTATAT